MAVNALDYDIRQRLKSKPPRKKYVFFSLVQTGPSMIGKSIQTTLRAFLGVTNNFPQNLLLERLLYQRVGSIH